MPVFSVLGTKEGSRRNQLLSVPIVVTWYIHPKLSSYQQAKDARDQWTRLQKKISQLSSHLVR